MRYRCSLRKKCGKRVKLKKPIDQYVKRPLCPDCGQDTLKLDEASYRRKRALKCTCNGLIPYPHERGSRGCIYATLTEEEEREVMEQIEKAAREGRLGFT